MSSQNKQEKKLIDEGIAKVREVVRNNISTNDIVLALHHFDLDVEKTIHAFLQGGHKEILGNWEQTGGSTAKKNKQKKNKSGTNKNNASGAKSPTALPPHINNNDYSNEYSSTSSTELMNGRVPRLLNGNTSQTVVSSTSYLASNYPTPTNNVVPSNNNSNKNGASNSTKKTGSPTITAQSSVVSGEEVARFQSLNDVAKSKAFVTQVDGLVNYGTEIDKLQNVLDNELSLSQANVLRCIQEIKQVLAERERQLCAELLRCRDDATELFNARRVKIQELNKKAQSAKGKERDNLFEELHSFNALKAGDKQIVYMTRFIYDNSKVLNSVASFGDVIPIETGLQAQNTNSSSQVQHAHESTTEKSSARQKQVNGNGVSVHGKENGAISNGNGHFSSGHSSIVSEASSELSQPSPIQLQKPAKNIAKVANNGIEIKSDGLSTDQLTDIQKRIEETLRSQGIDPSILSDIGVNTVAPRRRPPPNKSTAEKPRKVNGASGNTRANSNGNGNGPNQQKSKLKLSIIE